LKAAGPHPPAVCYADRSLRSAAPHAPRGSLAALVVCAFLAGAGGCQAPPAEKQDVQAIDITSVRRRLELKARVRDQEQKSKVSGEKTSYKENLYEENVKIETQGSVYHPNLLEFSLAGLFGLRQEDFERQFGDNLRTSSDNGNVIEFDAEGRFFKKKPYPGTVYARRYSSLDPRPFLSSLQNTTTNYGFVWQYVSAKTPTSLQFNSTDVKLDPLDKSEAPGRQQNTTLRLDTSYRASDYNVLSFVYDRRSVKEQPFNFAYDSDELTLSHRWDFGDHHQHRLTSELNYFNQTGTFSILRERWRESLRLTHSEALRSWYELEILDRKQGSLSGVAPVKETSYYASGTLEHRLYESLVSQLFGFAQYQDFDQSLKITRLGLQPSLNYRKKNPWGVLLGNYSYRVQTDDRKGSGLNMEVVDESATFRDPEPIILSNINVVLSSIVITSEDRLTNYHSGEDYRVRVVSNQVEIERVPTGRILDGQTVLISYQWMLGGDYKLTTKVHNFGLRQDFFFGLSPYYRLLRQDQTLMPADAKGARAEDIRANIFGTEYLKGPVKLVAELEKHQSNINPFDATRLSADLTQNLKNSGSVRLRTRWVDMDRGAPQNRRTKMLTVEGRYRQRLLESLTVEGAAMYRRENDSLSGPNRGIDFDLSLEWMIRETELRVRYEMGRFEDDFAQNRNQLLYVQFRRRF